MGSSAVMAPAGTKLWELPLCTKTCPRWSLAEPQPLATLIRKLGTWPHAPARITQGGGTPHRMLPLQMQQHQFKNK